MSIVVIPLLMIVILSFLCGKYEEQEREGLVVILGCLLLIVSFFLIAAIEEGANHDIYSARELLQKKEKDNRQEIERLRRELGERAEGPQGLK